MAISWKTEHQYLYELFTLFSVFTGYLSSAALQQIPVAKFLRTLERSKITMTTLQSIVFRFIAVLLVVLLYICLQSPFAHVVLTVWEQQKLPTFEPFLGTCTFCVSALRLVVLKDLFKFIYILPEKQIYMHFSNIFQW